MAPNTDAGQYQQSPFFAPSTPRKVVHVTTPGGTSRRIKQELSAIKEHKSTVTGATANLVNAIVGAGIVGIPFAIARTGLVAGVVLVALCAALTEKSLRLLIGAARNVGVPSYEMLCEATHGTAGFYFISANMLVVAYGGCLSYLILIKDTLPVLLGAPEGDVGMYRAILVVATLAVPLPISMQRDMADLAKTSRVSVVFQVTMALIVIVFSPVAASLRDHGGLRHIAANSIVETSTVFLGLGVLSFAYVCQHSAFIVAGSLERPSPRRWATATAGALGLCVLLEAGVGVAGYLAFLDATKGNILNNFLDVGGPVLKKAANVARGLLCTTMFFVYPMDSFVCRHILVVLFFRGRRAHEGHDASVLARRDRRVAVTLVVYFATLLPALLVDDVGVVLSLSGAIGASSLAYIGPGLIYMAVHGGEFLEKVEEAWGYANENTAVRPPVLGSDVESSRLLADASASLTAQRPTQMARRLVKDMAWYLLLMPLWCFVARVGEERLRDFREKEALKSPHVNRLAPQSPLIRAPQSQLDKKRPDGGSVSKTKDILARPPSLPNILPYGAVAGGNKAIGAAILAQQRSADTAVTQTAKVETAADVVVPATWYDFCVAIFFIVFGMVALCAGVVSIVMTR